MIHEQAPAEDAKEVEAKQFSLKFSRQYYEEAKVVELEKRLGESSPNGAAGPKRWVVALRHAPRSNWHESGRYYYPSSSAIFVTPLTDPSVANFTAAYPSLVRSRDQLRSILPLDRAGFYALMAKGRDPLGTVPYLPSEPFNNAGNSLLAHYKHLDFPWGSGFRTLTYYRQGETGYGATNVELTYDFQGLSASGDYYISARLAVRHPALPDSIDDKKAKLEETVAAHIAELRRVNRFKEQDFFPPLAAMDEMLGTLKLKK